LALALVVSACQDDGTTAPDGFDAPVPTPQLTHLPGHTVLDLADAQGPNDQPGQKDLTKLSSDFGVFNVSPEIYVDWNWDELAGFSGNNTGDACALFDTDGDGLVNYALCATIIEDDDGNLLQLWDDVNGNGFLDAGEPFDSPRLYICDESPASVANRRCTSSVLLNDADPSSQDDPDPTLLASTCSISSPVADDPFTVGDDYPQDTQASCWFDFADMSLPGGGGESSATLLNVCSYPSQVPNSDPSDCVVAPGTAFLIIEKDVGDAPDASFDFALSPPSSSGDGAATITTIDGTGLSDVFTVDAGTIYAVTELVPESWSLTDASCARDGSSTGTFDGTDAVTDIMPVSGQVTICSFVNEKQGTIIVEKQTLPDGSGQLFDFDGPGDFDPQLTDGGTGMMQVSPGTHTVSESLPDGWELTGITCDDGSSTVPSTWNVETATATYEVESGEVVNCIFTNTQKGKIIVEKQTDPDGSDQSFSFDGPESFDPSLTDGQTDMLVVSPGAYGVKESPATGWVLSDISCSDGASATASTWDVSTNTATYNVEPGEEVTCTFTNTQNGNITVVKNTVGGDDAFEFTSTSLSPSPFTLTTTGGTDSRSFTNLAPGSYDVAESDPGEMWDQTSAVCVDGDLNEQDPASITLDAGETVTCTFTNTKRASIKVAKETLPDGDAASFDFTGDITATLSDGQMSDAVLVEPGTYTVTESALEGWDLTDISCSEAGSSGDLSTATATFNVAAGDDVTCTFTNTKRGKIIVEKQTVPDQATGGFTFSGALSGSIGDDGTLMSALIEPGTYTVTESDPTPDFDLTGIICTDQASATASSGDTGTRTATFEVDPGEEVRCTFTNTQRGDIVIVKNTESPSGDGTFSYTGDLGAFDLTTVSGTASTTTQFHNTAPGTYAVTESDPTPDFDLVGLTCVDPDNGSSVTGATATIDLDPAETVMCTYTNRERGMVNLLKLTQGLVDPTKSWSFAIYEGPDGFGGTQLASSNTLGDGDGVLDFGAIKLNPDDTYTICELGVPAGWSTEWKVDTNSDGGADMIVIPYNPNADDPVPADVGNDCFDFGAGTSYPVPVGGTLVYQVNNTFPGGDPRTPGYWKNWNTCTSGNQVQTAANNGGPSEGWFVLDDILNDPGVSWGGFTIASCDEGVSILDQRDLKNGRKKASDAAYTLAMHLLAAQLNFAAGAEQCQAATDAVAEAEALLVSIGFDGSGNYLRPRDAEYQRALELAAILDQYNNGNLCQ
jgi:plastocyanin